MAVSWKWMLVALMTASLVVAIILLAGPGEVAATPTNQPTISYEELTRIVGPVAI